MQKNWGNSRNEFDKEEVEEVEEEEEGCGELGSLCCAIFSCLAIDLEYLKPQALHRLNQSISSLSSL